MNQKTSKLLRRATRWDLRDPQKAYRLAKKTWNATSHNRHAALRKGIRQTL